MSRTANPTSLDQLALATGGLILAGAGQLEPDVAEMLNWAFAHRPQNYWCGPTGPAGWGGADTVRILDIKFDAGLGSWKTKLIGMVKIDTDSLELTIGAACAFAVGESGSVRVTVGSAAPVVLSVSDADNGNLVTATVLTSATLTSWQIVTWDLRLDVGAVATNELRYVYLADSTPFALPAPL